MGSAQSTHTTERGDMKKRLVLIVTMAEVTASTRVISEAVHGILEAYGSTLVQSEWMPDVDTVAAAQGVEEIELIEVEP